MDIGHPLNCLTFNLTRAARALTRGFEEAARATGLTSSQFATLALLDGMGELSVGTVAEHLGSDRTTMTRNLDILTRNGLIAPVEGPDRRTRVVTLTPEGRERLGQAMPIWAEWQRRQVERLGEPSARKLLDVLQSL